MSDHANDARLSAPPQHNLLDVLGELMDLSSERRGPRLDAMNLSPDDREQVKRWLEASVEDSSLPEAPPREVFELLGKAPPPSIPSPPPAVTRIVEGPGSKVGQFTLLRRVGQGAAGVVFLAQQESSQSRPVALKIIRPAFDAAQIILEFETRRAALAEVRDRAVVRVIDSGRTASGSAFFASEWVDGIPITDFCDAQSLTLAQRLTLFAQVCQAVQAAHQHQLIHGGLKPANVLVEVKDEKPLAHITDFGISAATDMPDVHRKLFIDTGRWRQDVQYVPPERLGPEAAAPDPQSDIYSLGVLLYEVLSGAPALDPRLLRAELYDELCRIIAGHRPPDPSACLEAAARTLMAAGDADAVDARRLAASLRGGVDEIVKRCLEKKPSRRYRSAESLAVAVQDHLDHPSPGLRDHLRRLGRRITGRFRT